MDVNWTYCGDHFAMYTIIKSLCCTPETNITLYANYTLIFKKGFLSYLPRSKVTMNKYYKVQHFKHFNPN